MSLETVLEDIRRQDPGVSQVAYRTIPAFREGAEGFTPDHWLHLMALVTDAADDDEVEGVVVTHGTYTAEESAYLLHLTVRTAKPIVVVAAQRRHGTLSADGDQNLIDAMAVAGNRDAAGKGVLLVANEEIHSAREVVKTNQRPSGFVSRGVGLLGSIESDQVTFYRSPVRRHTASSEFVIGKATKLPRTDIVTAYPGADGVAVDALVEAGSRGIVVDGFSYAGKPHPLQMPALERARDAGIAVILANRGRNGRVPFGPRDGFVRADNLSAQKAHVLLTVALTATSNADELQRIFSEY